MNTVRDWFRIIGEGLSGGKRKRDASSCALSGESFTARNLAEKLDFADEAGEAEGGAPGPSKLGRTGRDSSPRAPGALAEARTPYTRDILRRRHYRQAGSAARGSARRSHTPKVRGCVWRGGFRAAHSFHRCSDGMGRVTRTPAPYVRAAIAQKPHPLTNASSRPGSETPQRVPASSDAL